MDNADNQNVNANSNLGQEQASQETNPSTKQTQPQSKDTDRAKLNYEDLLRTDKEFQSFLDKQVTKATQTAVQNAVERQKRLADERLSESERLKEMSAEQRAQYFEQKYKAAEQARIRDKEVESLKAQTISMLSENRIPDVFLDVFAFDNATAEDIKQRVNMLAEYEYYPKGELEKRVMAALNDKLKQKAPETRAQSVEPNDLFLQGFNSNYKAKVQKK